MVNNPLAMQERRVQSLGKEDSLEEEMATHSGILPQKILWTGKLGGLQSLRSQSQTLLRTEHTHTHMYYI